MMQRNRDPVKKGEVRPYEFLELLVLCESNSKISDKVKKIRNMVATFREDFEENLRSLLADPDKQVAIHLKRNLQLRERWLFPRKSQKTAEPTAFYREEQRQLKPLVNVDSFSAVSLDGEMGSEVPDHGAERHKKDINGAALKEKSLSKTKPTRPSSMSEPGIRAVGSEKWTLVTPVPPLKCRCYTKRISTPILSTEEIQALERERKDLQYRMLTLDARVMRSLKWKMDDYLPGYKKRVASVSIAAAPTPVRMTAPRTASHPDVFERLSTSGERSPSPCHAAACSAFKQELATKEGRGSSRVPNSSQARKMKESKTKKHRETWMQK